MTKVVFKNLKRSELVESAVVERIDRVLEKFSERSGSQDALAVVSMEGSRLHKGQGHFIIKLIARGIGRSTIVVQKRSKELYLALAALTDHLFETLHRTIEKRRQVTRKRRRSEKHLLLSEAIPEADWSA